MSMMIYMPTLTFDDIHELGIDDTRYLDTSTYQYVHIDDDGEILDEHENSSDDEVPYVEPVLPPAEYTDPTIDVKAWRDRFDWWVFNTQEERPVGSVCRARMSNQSPGFVWVVITGRLPNG